MTPSAAGMMAVDTARLRLRFGGWDVPCQIGRNGACLPEEKREGDGRTPIGAWPVRGVLLRPDRDFAPPGALPWRWLRPEDGWSDDPADAAYNRPVRHPHAFSAERLWRDDPLYDAILWLGHNDRPVAGGAGSAIFLHLAGPKPTEGCVAIDRPAMADLLARLPAGASIHIA